MTVRWSNVVAMGLLIAAIVIFVRNPDAIGGFLRSMQSVGRTGDPEESIRGLLAAGFVGVLIVAVVRIVTHNNGSKDQ